MRTSSFRPFRSAFVLAVFIGLAATLASAAPFTVVLLPDTQNYAEKFPDTYMAQTQWIADSAKAENIKFAIHLGDIVQHANNEAQWKVADAAHALLEKRWKRVPYSVVPGNHDMDHKEKSLIRDTTLYDKYFPPSRFAKRSWYGGAMSGSNANNYCTFKGNGMKFLVLSLEFAPPNDTLLWASKILEAHPDHRVIVATHYHMRPDGRGKDDKVYGLDGNAGEKLWEKLIRKHANIFMVVSGHVLGLHHTTSLNAAGLPVHEILCDYQGYPNGGDGWLQSLRFVPEEDKIYVNAYSPLLKKSNTDPKETYILDYDME
jgi:predicted phosphodiesterase